MVDYIVYYIVYYSKVPGHFGGGGLGVPELPQPVLARKVIGGLLS